MDLHPWTVHPALWKYRTEGGQKLLLECICPHCSQHPSRPSTPRHHPKFNVPVILCLYSTQGPLPQTRHPYFITTYIPSRYLLPAYPVTIPNSILNQLVDGLPSRRSIHKLKHHNQALVHSDAKRYFGQDTVLVELKTKDAVLPTSKLIPVSIAQTLRKYTVPFYQIKNYVMPSGGFSMPQCPYDPADLLSGQNGRTRHAVQVLLKEESRALRIFRNNRTAETDDELVDMAACALVADQCAVSAIRKLQGLDMLDRMGGAMAMRALASRLEEGETAKTGKNTSISRAEEIVMERIYVPGRYEGDDNTVREKLCYSSAQEAEEYHCEAEYQRAKSALEQLSVEQLVDVLTKYMVAAAAKDFSLLVAMRKVGDGDVGTMLDEDDDIKSVDNYEEFGHGVHGHWMYRIWIIDVGEKDSSKVTEKWPLQEAALAEALQNNL